MDDFKMEDVQFWKATLLDYQEVMDIDLGWIQQWDYLISLYRHMLHDPYSTPVVAVYKGKIVSVTGLTNRNLFALSRETIYIYITNYFWPTKNTNMQLFFYFSQFLPGKLNKTIIFIPEF